MSSFNNGTAIFVSLAAVYIGLVRLLRYKRIEQTQDKYKLRKLSDLTLEDAHAIQLALYEVEFPFLAKRSLEFALFKTYGIPTISSLLMATRQLGTKTNASKRMTDTTVLVLEIMKQPPGSPRSTTAIARMNFLHSLYQRSGKISNEDLLYTLSLFFMEPIRWIKKHEWRGPTDLEICAMGVFWKHVGDAMKIDFSVLPGSAKGFESGLQFMDEVDRWCEDYEREFMVPAQSNKDTADCTTELLLYSVPEGMKARGLQVVSALMDVRLRKAMLYEDPPSYMQKLVDGGLEARKLALRYLALPRPYFLRLQILADETNSHGKVNKLLWDAEPWYVEPTFVNRWCLQSWMDWAAGRPVPGDDGDKYKPEGYLLEEIGPPHFAGKGVEEAKRDADNINKVMSAKNKI